MPKKQRGRSAAEEDVPAPAVPSGGGQSAARLAFAAAAAVCALSFLIMLPEQLGSRSADAAPLVQGLIKCLAQCASLGPQAQRHVAELGEKAAANRKSSTWRLPKDACGNTQRRCDVVRDAFCSGLQCQLNSSGVVGGWFPLRTATAPPVVSPDSLGRGEAMFASYTQCSQRCASQQYLTVEMTHPVSRSAISLAAARLEECGLVHISGGAWPGDSLKRLKTAADALAASPLEEQSRVKKSALRANRTELFMPFEPDMPDPLADGAISAVVSLYVDEPFSLDYVSVLNARAGVAGTQDLHADVAFFPRTSLSVHTVLEDITRPMGPTLFCPCTHSMTSWERAPLGDAIGEAVRFNNAFRTAIRETGSAAAQRCLGAAYVPSALRAGLVTIYDGAVLHAGLANVAERDRLILNVNFAAPAGYEVLRNYTGSDPARAVAETNQWRARSNGARPAVETFQRLREWVRSLPEG